VTPLYQTSTHKSVHQSYNTVVLQIEALGELANGHFFASRKALDRQQCLMLLRRKSGLARGILAERSIPSRRCGSLTSWRTPPRRFPPIGLLVRL
jgi:hypothetical protein